jgi:hypothetical protein
MVADQNLGDDYAQTLQKAFTSHKAQLGARVTDQTIFYDSDPALEPPGVARGDYVKNQFSQFPFHAQLCQDRPDMVYFAGRADDLEQFITAVEGAQPCSNSLTGLDVITGDDGSNLVGLPLALDAPIRIRLYYTGLAAPDEWQAFPADPGYQKTVYQPFRNAFTQTGFRSTDLDDGDAMMHYDAVLTTAPAIRLNASSGQSPSAVVLEFNNLGCAQGISGASGYIAYTDASEHAPYDKAMPVMQITTGGRPSRAGFAWPTGKPLDRSSPSC